MKEKLKNYKERNKGITLIVLIITIIVLLILAGISVNLLLGENGILQRAKDTKEVYDKSKMMEDMNLILADYSIERETIGTTLEDYLTKKNIDFEIDGENIKVQKEGYIVTVNKITLEMDEPVKTLKYAKIGLSSSSINPNDELIVTLTFGQDVDIEKCKYKFEKSNVEVTKESMENGTSVTNTTISNLQTSEKGEYYFYLLVGYKDSEETILKKSKVTIGIPVTIVTLNQTNLDLYVGNIVDLIVSVEPTNAVQAVTWSTNNASVATVTQQGKVTAVSGGTAQITVTSDDDITKTATCEIFVDAIQSIEITTAPTKTEYNKGDTLDLTGMVVTATYSSGRTRTLTANEYTVSPANQSTLSTAGNITITVSKLEGEVEKQASVQVSVVSVPEWTLTDNDNNNQISVGDLLTPKRLSVASEQFYVASIGTQTDPVISIVSRLCVKTNDETAANNVQTTSANTLSWNDAWGYKDTYVNILTAAGLSLENTDNSGGISRFMTYTEAQVLRNNNVDAARGTSTNQLSYWLVQESSTKAYIYKYGSWDPVSTDKVQSSAYCLRPVINILASSIEIPSNS